MATSSIWSQQRPSRPALDRMLAAQATLGGGSLLTVDRALDRLPITSSVNRAGIAGNVFLPATASGLPKDSVAVPLGLELIDRSLLAERAGRLPDVLIDDFDEGLRAVLGI